MALSNSSASKKVQGVTKLLRGAAVSPEALLCDVVCGCSHLRM